MKTLLFAIAISTLFSCSLPKVYLIDDPLTAHQHNDLGYIYESQGRYELAEKEYKLALKKDKDWSIPYFNLGNVRFKQGDPAKAEEYYRTGLKKDPNNPDIMNNLALVLCELGQYEQAQEWITRAVTISPKEEYLDTQKEILSRKPRSSPCP